MEFFTGNADEIQEMSQGVSTGSLLSENNISTSLKETGP
jgi:hypothetical protein